MLCNIGIRERISAMGLKHWQIAKAVGISPWTLSVWLRDELSGNRLDRVERAIKECEGGTNERNIQD